jgi:phytoene synthase
LDHAKAAPAEPRLQAVARELLPVGVSGHELSRLEDAWLPLLEPFPWGEAQVEGLKLRGRILFGIGARLLGREPAQGEAAGELWSLEDGARHTSDAASRTLLGREALAVELPVSSGRGVRALTVLAATALANLLEPSSGLARGMAALRHRTTGRFPRRS